MQDNNLVLIVLGVAILAAVFAIVTPVSPDEVTISPEQKALIAKHELMPGLTRETAIDMIATNWIHWGESGWVVWLETLGPRGTASIDSRMSPEMVIESWGPPDATRETGLGLTYVYLQPPEGEIHAVFNSKGCFDVRTVLFPEYFRRRFPKWTDTECVLVATEQVALGMTPQIARASWGNPSDIIHSVDSWGTREQWVYRSALSNISTKYLYFENGILTSWQY
jgi:hypothetical protein